MAGGAEITSLAREGQKNFVLALLALDAGKAVSKIPTSRSHLERRLSTLRIASDIALRRPTRIQQSGSGWIDTAARPSALVAGR